MGAFCSVRAVVSSVESETVSEKLSTSTWVSRFRRNETSRGEDVSLINCEAGRPFTGRTGLLATSPIADEVKLKNVLLTEVARYVLRLMVSISSGFRVIMN